MSRKDEISAGLLAFRRTPRLEFLLAHPGGPYWARRDAGSWTIPKGLVRPDDLLAGARREFQEETGFTAEGPFLPLSPVRQKSGKTVHAFAFAGDFDPAGASSNLFELEWPPHSGKIKQFVEIDRLEWLDPDAAHIKIIAYQRPLLEEFLRRYP
jgi:predicted NUDIX family NTP pyrophosphohydrolase